MSMANLELVIHNLDHNLLSCRGSLLLIWSVLLFSIVKWMRRVISIDASGELVSPCPVGATTSSSGNALRRSTSESILRTHRARTSQILYPWTTQTNLCLTTMRLITRARTLIVIIWALSRGMCNDLEAKFIEMGPLQLLWLYVSVHVDGLRKFKVLCMQGKSCVKKQAVLPRMTVR